MLALSPAAHAGAPFELTNNQLDRVTAGATGSAVSDALAQGGVALTGTSVITLVNSVPQPPGVPSVFDTTTGVGIGEAVSSGSKSSNTSVTTGATAAGNRVLTFSGNGTTSVLGVNVQAGFTLAQGSWEIGF